MRRCRRRRRGEDVSPHFIHDQQVSVRVRSNGELLINYSTYIYDTAWRWQYIVSLGLWQLRCDSDDRWRALYFGTLWHSWARGLRQIETPLVPSDRRLPRLFFRRQSKFIWKCERKGTSTCIYILPSANMRMPSSVLTWWWLQIRVIKQGGPLYWSSTWLHI